MTDPNARSCPMQGCRHTVSTCPDREFHANLAAVMAVASKLDAYRDDPLASADPDVADMGRVYALASEHLGCSEPIPEPEPYAVEVHLPQVGTVTLDGSDLTDTLNMVSYRERALITTLLEQAIVGVRAAGVPVVGRVPLDAERVEA
jgi:hypothetical protein